MTGFRFLTPHAGLMVAIAAQPGIEMRALAAHLGLRPRAAQRLTADLVAAGYVQRTRRGRRFGYTVRADLAIALPTERDLEAGALWSVLLPSAASDERRRELAAAAVRVSRPAAGDAAPPRSRSRTAPG